MGGEKVTRPQPYQNYKKLKKESGRVGLLQGPTGVVQFQTLSPENIHTSNLIRTEKVIFRTIYVYIHIKIGF